MATNVEAAAGEVGAGGVGAGDDYTVVQGSATLSGTGTLALAAGQVSPADQSGSPAAGEWALAGRANTGRVTARR